MSHPTRINRTLTARLRVDWFILRTCIEERLVYRGDFFFATFMRFLPIVTQIFLWGAIFGIHTDDPKLSLNGYSYQNMFAYYLLYMVARAFSSMPGLASGIAREVRDGTVKKYLTQPIDMLGYLFWHRVAHKLVYYVVAAGPFALVFYLCRSYFPAGWPYGFTLCCWFASLIMAFLIGFLLEALIGMVSFWFLEVSSLLFIYMMFNYFLSGHMLPLDYLKPFSDYILMLPFKYLAYFPATVPLGRYSHAELIGELGVELAWVVGLFLLNRVTFRIGVKRYSAFGG